MSYLLIDGRLSIWNAISLWVTITNSVQTM